MGHNVHTGLSCYQRRHFGRDSIINNRNIGDNIRAYKRIFDILFRVGNNGEGGNFGGGSGGRRNTDQPCFCPQLREFEGS